MTESNRPLGFRRVSPASEMRGPADGKGRPDGVPRERSERPNGGSNSGKRSASLRRRRFAPAGYETEGLGPLAVCYVRKRPDGVSRERSEREARQDANAEAGAPRSGASARSERPDGDLNSERRSASLRSAAATFLLKSPRSFRAHARLATLAVWCARKRPDGDLNSGPWLRKPRG
jgi:hypothetical protein